ncbi:glycosyltransferase family 2 protein [Rhizobium lentis]|uniref:Glycosyltransferase n=1 Tax=Rhizobium lentis TaxID=1138194 RepID=A0A9Q3M952_9HYPH|nr:glycosyltransferase family 2 protein [Rhizobium lentis]MBX4998086.1 glycosyltransferase [Rhizobium lentis]MBX5008498.1 glycosyltransferase [Rhizobium lentis]MBX5016789.1 glycosyltransferase [Rhizobium lentis]MBX5023701.1 glycosyltransferase [Rhizobium lentis]MBX5066226.1 glycosyltransferase [Rhizobium lentis]
MATDPADQSPPRISLITVCWNAERTIADTLRSIDTQTYHDFEHIIIDGGSNDSTLAIIASAPADNRRVVSGRDGGIYEAMNKGIGLATGDIIGFLNADDTFEGNDSLETVAAALDDEAYDGCYGDLVYVSNRHTDRKIRYWKSRAFKSGSFARGWCPPHPTFYVRRSIYERFGRFDLRYRLAADVELMMRFLEVARIRTIYIPRVLVRMRLGGATNKNVQNISRQNKEVLRALADHGLKVSTSMFWAFKIANRLGQFLMRNRPQDSSV